jgi:hypothetical protein
MEKLVICDKASICTAAIMGECTTQIKLNDYLANIYKNDKRAATVLEFEVANCKSKHGV